VAATAAPYRSLLYVPAHDEARLRAAFATEADAVVCDLEDAVPAGAKEVARAVVARVLSDVDRGPARLLRINSPETSLGVADLELVAALPLDALVVPKATATSLCALASDGPPVIAVVETGRGIRDAFAIAELPRVAALALGAGDLAADLGLEQTTGAEELLYARSKLVVDSAAAGIRRPFDRVYPFLEDLAGLEEETRFARALGFAGKNCTHPAQPPVVNRVFSERHEEVSKDALYTA
jgi:citrate lyase beta subunit